MKKYLAFFDLDHTILTTSSGRLYLRYAYQEKLLGPGEVLKGIILALIHRLGVIETKEIIKRWAMKYKGESEIESIEITNRWFHEGVIKYFRPSIINEINYHKNNNGIIVILSAATTIVCNEVKDYLNLDDVICTELEVEKGLFTGNLKTEYCNGKEKLIRASRYSESSGFSLKDAYFYGDSYADRFILEKVGKPVCVAPDWKLKKHAKKMNWRVIDH